MVVNFDGQEALLDYAFDRLGITGVQPGMAGMACMRVLQRRGRCWTMPSTAWASAAGWAFAIPNGVAWRASCCICHMHVCVCVCGSGGGAAASARPARALLTHTPAPRARQAGAWTTRSR